MSDETTLSGSVKRKRLVWGLASAAVVVGGLAIAGLLGAFTPLDHTEEALRAGEQAEPKVVQSSPTVPLADQTPTPTEIPAQPSPAEAKAEAPEPTNCYDNDWLRVVLHEKATPDTRRDFAGSMGATLQDKGIRATAAGEGAQFLLFTSDPENTDQLKEWELIYQKNSSAKANVCLKGFSEAQFIVRDADMTQHLLVKIPTEIRASWMFLAQQYGTTPMK